MAKSEGEVRVWPRPQQIRFSGKGLALARPVSVRTRGDADWLATEARKAAEVLNRATGKKIALIPEETGRSGGGKPSLTVTTMDALPAGSGPRQVGKPEGYALSVAGEGILLAGRDAAGIFYGAQTLAQLVRTGGGLALPGVTVRDWPRYPMRGAHLYLPPREQLDFFRRFLDFLAGLKFNLLVLEIGGGMEYERHPEINTAWRRFCREAMAYEFRKDRYPESRTSRPNPRHPAGPCSLQTSRYFPKDSVHPELAGGEYLTKRDVQKIVAACAERHIEIIPEVQSLSHSYYLCVAHPEIAERTDDPWPDTYCPSDPRSYELLFDVMEEVIEAFRPRTMHIGHDEAYTFRVCPRCRERTGHDILAGDVNRIHGFLAERGIRTMMWGDKLMNITTPEGRRYGGVARRRTDPVSGKTWVQPETWKAAGQVPKDLFISDWYWSLDPRSERNFHRHGFEEIYGNFDPLRFEKWETRANVPNVRGAEISTWCEVSAEAFGHNGIFHRYFPGADMLWRGLQMEREKVCALMAGWMPQAIDRLTQRPRQLAGGKGGRFVPLDVSGAADPLPEALTKKMKTGKQLSTAQGAGAFELMVGVTGHLEKAIVLDATHPRSTPLRVDRRAEKLLVLHGTTMEDVYFQPTYYSFHRGPAELLEFRVEYADGKHASFNTIYGEDIGPVRGLWPSSTAGYCYRAVPILIGETHVLYAQEWANPRPKARIARVVVALGADAVEDGEVLVAAMSMLA